MAYIGIIFTFHFSPQLELAKVESLAKVEFVNFATGSPVGIPDKIHVATSC